MTRRSKRELEHDLDRLTGESAGDSPSIPPVVHEDPATGQWYPTAEMDTPLPAEVKAAGTPLMLLSSETGGSDR